MIQLFRLKNKTEFHNPSVMERLLKESILKPTFVLGHMRTLRTNFVLLGLLILSSFFSCNDTGMDLEALEARQKAMVQRAEGVEILYSDSARLLVRISGRILLDYLDKFEPRTEFPEGVMVEFFDDQSVVKSELTANYGIQYPKKNETIVRDSVVFKTVEGERLETEELIWEENTGRVYSNKFCVIHKKNEIIQGYGFESNEDFSNSKIRKVTGRIEVDPIEP